VEQVAQAIRVIYVSPPEVPYSNIRPLRARLAALQAQAAQVQGQLVQAREAHSRCVPAPGHLSPHSARQPRRACHSNVTTRTALQTALELVHILLLAHPRCLVGLLVLGCLFTGEGQGLLTSWFPGEAKWDRNTSGQGDK
jgi:hypothetical protein